MYNPNESKLLKRWIKSESKNCYLVSCTDQLLMKVQTRGLVVLAFNTIAQKIGSHHIAANNH